MKKFLTICIFCFSICGCTTRIEKKVTPPVNSDKQLLATEALELWLDKFPENSMLTAILDSIKLEYPSLKNDIRFLDSIKGLKIDFIGMMHSTMGTGDDTALENAAVICQKSIGKIIDTSHYILIGTEGSSDSGRITWTNFINEMILSGQRMATIQTGQRPKGSIEEANKIYAPFASHDYVLSRLYQKKKRPYITGTEPSWVWLAG